MEHEQASASQGLTARWIEPQAVDVPGSLRQVVGGHPLVAETLARRGIRSAQEARAFLDPDAYQPASPFALPDMERACQRIERAIAEGERVAIWGDFDVDGQTSTTLLVCALRDLGAEVAFHIPLRGRESHGVNIPELERLIEDGAGLIVTCDTGIRAHGPVAHARARGVDIVITDHHDLPEHLPAAEAAVNPKRLPADHPLRTLPGVGCAYKLAEALYQRAGRPQAAAQYHDLAALGIVADVATLAGDTRHLLQRGLRALRRTERLGLLRMMKIAGIHPERLNEEQIGFGLAPRLNALGRLADANEAVELLTTRDPVRAETLARQVEALNIQRKQLTLDVLRGAEAQIKREPALLERSVLVLDNAQWHEGVIGLVAGRLAEAYGRPTVLITGAAGGGPWRGSARSVEGCDISAAIAANGDLLTGFGGHPMAAGFGIEPERIADFRRGLSQSVREACGAEHARPPLRIDGYFDLQEITLDLVAEIERLAPFGPGHPPLHLATRNVAIRNQKRLGKNSEHLRLEVEDQTGAVRGVFWWQWNEAPLPDEPFDLAYTVRANDYQGQEELQIEWIDARPLAVEESLPASEELAGPPARDVVDYRDAGSPLDALRELRRQHGGELQVWREGEVEVAGVDRLELEKGPALAIWTAPPSPRVLAQALADVDPQRVYLFAIDPDLDDERAFLTRLGGLAKRSLRADGGQVSLTRLAAATAQQAETVEAGIAWLVAHGDLIVTERQGDDVTLALGTGQRREDLLVAATKALRGQLQETAAYRRHVRGADKDVLIA